MDLGSVRKRCMKNTVSCVSDAHFYAFEKSISAFSVLSREEEQAVAADAKNGERKARELLVKANMRYAIQVARSYFRTGIDNMDIIQEALLGLSRAVESNRFNPELGFRFITFADPYIRNEIRRFLTESQTLSFSIDAGNELSRVKKAFVLAAEESENASYEELCKTAADIAHLPEKKAKLLLNVGAKCMSIDDAIRTDSEKLLTLGDTIADERTSFVEDEAVAKETVREIKRELSSFSKRERTAILLHSMHGESFAKIGRATGLSREGVRLICKRAESRLKRHFA